LSLERGAYTPLLAGASNGLKRKEAGAYLEPFGKKRSRRKISEAVELVERL
jgi:hypothetical protein